MLWYKKPGNWVDKMLCSELLAFFTDMKYWYFLVIVFVPWTAGWQMAAGIEPPNPANPLVVSPSEGWNRTHTSTRREEDKISQNSTKTDKGEKKTCKKRDTLQDCFEWNISIHPDSYYVDLHGHQQRVQSHQKGRDAEPQVLQSNVILSKLPQLDGLCDEG